jgi:ADP-ribose pyrophosphatase YjhB (NUDIX family)
VASEVIVSEPSEIEALREELEKVKTQLRVTKDLKNGSNLIVLNEHGQILVVKEKSRKKLWMLPGGEIERGESPRHAAQSETEEESGIISDEATYKLIGIFVQKPKGLLTLYETSRFSGEISTEYSDDTSEARFMSFEEIIEKPEDFRTAYLRLIIHWRRYSKGIDKAPIEGRLSDEVEIPRNLDGINFNDLVLRV